MPPTRACRIGADAMLHGRVGETIEAQAGVSLDEEVGALALHYYEAQRWDKAWEFCRRAGDRALDDLSPTSRRSAPTKRPLVAGRRLRSVTRAELAEVHERIGDVRST